LVDVILRPGNQVAGVATERRRKIDIGGSGSWVAMIDLDPELGSGVPEHELGYATRQSLARCLRLDHGVWSSPAAPDENGSLGLHVISGFVSNRLQARGRATLEILGPGDLLRPWAQRDAGSIIGSRLEWTVHTETELAVLDAAFARRMARWPEVFATLLHRATLRARRLALQAAINANPTVQERLMLTMWSYADRWGRVTPDGVRLPLALRHHHLAAAIGARRPSVSSAVSALRDLGRLDRVADGWMLHGSPPAEYVELRESSLL
jgi:CRP/FNR family cyclic AMP-dependent transcriptional regulator